MYFGDKRRIKNPFRNCKTPLEIFHVNRKIQQEKQSMLQRVLVLFNSDGSLRLEGQGVVDISNTLSLDTVFG